VAHKHVRLALIAAFVAASTGAFAQAQLTFRSGIDLVRMDIRVVDAAGRPLTDLRQDEIVITEDGTSRPALLFQRVTEPAEMFVDAATRAVTAEVSTNEGFPRGHLYLLVFDQAHITAGNEQRARLAAEQFIRRHVRPSDRVALFAIPGPGPQIGFTTDRVRVIEELMRVRGSYQRVASTPFGNMPIYDAHRLAQGDERLMIDTIKRLTTEGGGDMLGVSANATVSGRGGGGAEDMGVARRLLVENARAIINTTDAESRQFLQRLADVIRGLGDIEGRKSVVLFSEGFFQDNLSRELESVAAAAAQTYSVFYSFDLNRRGPSVTEAYASDTVQGSEIQARIAPLGTLAAETDGTLVIDAATRSEDALTQIAAQAQDYYLVGFEPSEQARSGRNAYRRVTITVTRPGAKVSTRTGYSLRPESTAADRQRAISSVLGAPFVQQGLKVDYTTYLLKSDTPGQQRVMLSLAAQLPVQARPTDRADVIFVVRDVRDGRVVASGTDALPLPVAARDGATIGTGTWRVQFALPAGSYLMRTVVREPGGLSGSADRRIDVRPLDTPDIAVSDLILGSHATALPVRAQAYADDGVSGLLEAYARAANQLDNLSLTVSVRTTDGKIAKASYTSPLPAPVSDGSGFVIRAPFTLPLPAVEPGTYVVHATLADKGSIIAERTRFVDVAAGTAGPGPARPAPAAAPPVPPKAIVEGQLGQALIAELLERSRETAFKTATENAARGEWERAEAAVTKAGDTDFVAQSIRGLTRFVREDFPGAVVAWTQAQTLQPEHALTAFFLGWAHDKAGDTRAALTAWRGAAHLDPMMVSAHLALADGYLKLQQPALARQALRAGLDALPNSVELRQRLLEIEGR
jgi:VWFA-related protein